MLPAHHQEGKIMLRSLSIIAATLGLAMACGSQVAHAGSSGQYVEAGATLRTDAEVEAWYDITAQLRRQFDEICGDTFCEGDYSNLQPLRFQCSVEARSRRISACVWSFAGSQESIDPATGGITVQPGFWQCRIPLVSQTNVERLLAALDNPQPLFARLPGTDQTVLDGLIECL
jgi:hypothetical protein